jgi:fatty-acyl-CoA synthase
MKLDLDNSLDQLADQLPTRGKVIVSNLRTIKPIATVVVPWLARMRTGKIRSLVDVLRENAKVDPRGLAVEMDDVRLDWHALDRMSSEIAHVLHEAGVRKGDSVALLGANSPFYLATMLGISRAGGTAALINNHNDGPPLDHAIRVSRARVLVVESEYVERVNARPAVLEQIDTIFRYGKGGDLEEAMASAPRRAFEPVPVEVSDDFVYIYTSGTTGFPKPCRVSHERTLSAGAGFQALMLQFKPGDKLYNVLPLYHASALLIGVGSCMVTRTPVALRRHFSASAFWDDVRRYDATAVLYIGELCRYLVNTHPEGDKSHRVRVAVGNGLRPDVWVPFQELFGIPAIREFYAATEAPGFLFNTTGKVGAIGRMPPDALGWMRLVKFDVDAEEHIRDASGYCIPAKRGEVGELVVRLPKKLRLAVTEFRGYTDEEATKKKILTDLFEPGDRYFRSGDLLRVDDEGFVYFVDRIGDTFRCKGENVSTAEVADVLSAAEGVEEVTVIGVRVPPHDGQFGLAAVVPSGEFDARAFFETAKSLPSYAQPRFVRVLDALQKTGTFKVQKTELRRDGIDRGASSGPLYLRTDDGYVPMDESLHRAVTTGEFRL